MQIAYFDESGIDGSHGITLISGVVARLQDWPGINSQWQEQIRRDGVPCFHYYECKNQTGAYAGWDWHLRCTPHLDRLAQVVSLNAIGGITAAFLGDWAEATVDRPDLRERFPQSTASVSR